MNTTGFIKLVLLSLLAINANADPGIPDTLRVDSITTYPGSGIILPVYFYNDEPLSAVEFVFSFDGDFLDADSISLEGSRIEYIDPGNIVRRDTTGLVHLFAFDAVGWIPRGNGLLCNLYFTIDAAAVGQSFLVDSTRWGFAKTYFADSEAAAIYPQFVPGYITVQEPPPSYDSVWVDRNVVGSPGQTINVNVYGYNEVPLDTVHLALEYSSSNLKFVSSDFVGTRGESALNRIVSGNNELRQILVTLIYSNDFPLMPGTGILATLQLEIDSNATTETVIIDSTSYLGAQSLEFSPTNDAGGITFTPFFTAGEVHISTGTPVEDNNKTLLPTEFALKQNYPNPFNPGTTIAFDLPEAADVELVIYNILGQKVRTLINRRLPAGTHSATFDGRSDSNQKLASGVYLYRLSAGEYSQSRKMTLMK